MSRRGVWVFVTIVLVEVVVLVAIAAWFLLGARQELAQARDDTVAGRAALSELDLVAAERSFADAADGFDRGAATLANPVVRLVGATPVVGRNVATTEALAVSGRLVTSAARDVVTTIADQPDGLQSYLPADGRLPVDRLADLADVTGRADAQLADAAATVDAAPADGLLGPVADARAGFVEELGQARDLVGSAADASSALVAFLGGDGPRRYLIGAQNPAELRGTGGYVGAYSVATFTDGRFELGRFVPVQQLRSLPISEIPPPSRDFAERYNRFGGAGFWQAINATPDFPSAAGAMVRLYERTEGEELDGAVVVDPFALEALLALVGPVQVPGVGRVASDNVVAVVSNEAYADFDGGQVGNVARKEVLGGVAATALRRLLSGDVDADTATLVDALAPLGADRHLLLYSTDADVQAAFARLDLDGGLPEPAASGDTVAVVVNNAAINKVDYYVDRVVEQRVRLRPDGSAAVRLRATFRNTAPASGPGSYVLGPQLDQLSAGDDLSLVSVFCGRCRVTGADPRLVAQGFRRGTTLGRELGHTVATSLLTVPQGQETTMTVSWTIADAWDPQGDGCYRALHVTQPTIRGTTWQLAVEPPDGWRAVGERDGADGQVAGKSAVTACYAA